VGVALVIPVVVGVRSARQGRTFLRVFAGLGVLTVLVLLINTLLLPVQRLIRRKPARRAEDDVT
jgi:hypothetical protein